jgi:excisionase family DNA binding protein
MHNPRLAHSVSEACSIACAGRTALYEAIRSGELRAVKRGRRTLILNDDLRRWLEALPPVSINNRIASTESVMKAGSANPGYGVKADASPRRKIEIPND